MSMINTDEHSNGARDKEQTGHFRLKEDGKEDMENFFDASLFVNESYMLREHKIGNHTISAFSSEAASTDFDLTGQLVWPGAEMLNEYLCQHGEKLVGKSVLELGAGVGLTGLLCSRYCSKVVMTDHNDIVLKVIQENIDLQGSNEEGSSHLGRLECAKLEWGNAKHIQAIMAKHPEGFDFILGADLCYQQESIKPLLDTVLKFMAAHRTGRCVFLLGYIDRWNSIGRLMLGEAAAHCLAIRKALEKPIQGGALHGTVYEMVKVGGT